MSSLIRRNQNRDMMSVNEAMNHLFDQAFVPFNGRAFGPNVDVIEHEDKVVVKAEMPGFTPDEIDVRVEGNVLTLRGENKKESEKQEGQYHLRERQQSNFVRTLQLPSHVAAEKANADFENGILTLTLPKHEAAMPKRITIQPRSNGKK